MSDLSQMTSGGSSSPVDPNEPVMTAWTAYKESESYANTEKWALYRAHVEGSLWAAFHTGFTAARTPPVPMPVYKAVERILDEHSAWIAAPNEEIVKKIALAATFAAHAALSEAKHQIPPGETHDR